METETRDKKERVRAQKCFPFFLGNYFESVGHNLRGKETRPKRGKRERGKVGSEKKVIARCLIDR